MNYPLTTWEERLNRAEQVGQFDLDDYYKSEHWDTCDVGEHTDFNDAFIFRVKGPSDDILKYLGYKFMQAVRNNYVATAIDLHQLIMNRIRDSVTSGGGA